MLAAVAVKTSQCYLGLGDYSYPKLVYSSSDCQPSPSYFCRHHPSTDDRLSPEPSQADLGLFSHSISPKKIALARKSNTKQRPSAGCSCFVCPSLRHDAAEAATRLPLLSHASIHLGRVAVRLLCQDVTAFLVLQIQLGKAGKRKELHQQVLGDPEISQPLGILPFQGRLA